MKVRDENENGDVTEMQFLKERKGWKESESFQAECAPEMERNRKDVVERETGRSIHLALCHHCESPFMKSTKSTCAHPLQAHVFTEWVIKNKKQGTTLSGSHHTFLYMYIYLFINLVFTGLLQPWSWCRFRTLAGWGYQSLVQSLEVWEQDLKMGN